MDKLNIECNYCGGELLDDGVSGWVDAFYPDGAQYKWYFCAECYKSGKLSQGAKKVAVIDAKDILF